MANSACSRTKCPLLPDDEGLLGSISEARNYLLRVGFLQRRRSDEFGGVLETAKNCRLEFAPKLLLPAHSSHLILPLQGQHSHPSEPSVF